MASKQALPGIAHALAVASGKGGVGKTVENMSYFVCPHCGERHEVFQHSERWRPEASNDVPVLGRVPMTAEISRGIDREHPLMADFAPGDAPQHAETAQAAAFLEIGRAVKECLTGER